MRELRQFIEKVNEEELRHAKTPQERAEAHELIFELTKYEENEHENLRQRDLLNKLRRSPLVVPQEYFEDVDRTYKLALTMKGEAWARHELKKIWRAEVEFWGKLILPVLALVISIIALVHKTR